MPNTELAELPDIIQFWRIQQLWERLLGNTEQAISELPANYLARLLTHSDVESLAELIAKKACYSELVSKAMDKLFSEFPLSQQEIDDWQEQALWGVHILFRLTRVDCIVCFDCASHIAIN